MASEEEESNNEDEQRFLRMFSKQLADVLRAKDEEEAEERERLRGEAGGSSRKALGGIDETKEWERLRSTYIELCHDDPIISGGNGDCRRLAKALIPKQQKKSTKLIVKKDKLNAKNNANKLALSCRLVDGIIQATARVGEKGLTSAASSNNITTQTNDINNNADTTSEQEESMFSPTITTSEGYAEIAFAVFVEGPYKCIQKADNLQIASKFLGSFQPPDTSSAQNNEQLNAEERSRLVDEATAKIVSGLEKISMEEEVNGSDSKSADKIAQDDASGSSSEMYTSNPTPQSQQILDDDNDSMAEVFAEESDPDDYDFGPSAYGSHSSTSHAQAIFGGQKQDAITDSSFNPLTLSEPRATNQTWEGARKAIHHLLSCASYGKFALGSISSRAWSQGDMSETLADFAFMLLLENDDKVDASSKQLQDSLLCTQENSEDILALWDRPLFLLRDRAMDKNHGHDALPAYLQLLTAFLSHSDEHDVMSILSSPLGNASHTENNNTLSPATTVGLSSLASVCSSKEMLSKQSSKMTGTSIWSVCPRDEVKKAILSSLYSLAHIMESVRPSKPALGKNIAPSSTPDNSPWIRTAVCIISVIEYMTNLQARFDFQPLYEGGGKSQSGTTLSVSDAKEISNSGLFREMLSLYTLTRPEKNEESSSGGKKPTAEDVVRTQLLRTIFTLSAQSPELLGRYAVRVPEFANEVHSSTFMENNLVDGILWASIGSSLLENKSDASSSKPKLKLRANSKLNAKKTPQIETKTLAERSILWFVALCMSSKKALEDMKQLILSAESNDLSDDQKKEYAACKDTFGKLKEFSNCLANCPPATTMWLDSLKNKEDAISIARASIEELKSTLATLPSFSDKEMNTLHQGHKKDDDDKCTESPKEGGLILGDNSGQHILQKFRKEYEAVVASLRSSVKVIALGIESQRGSGLSVTGSSVAFNAPSKTD